MKRSRSYLPATQHAVAALGAQIAAARRGLGWTSAELAERLGVSAPVVSRIENGSPTTGVGTVFEAAVLCGVPLFGVEGAAISKVADLERARLAALPTRVRKKPPEIDDDF